MRASRYGVRTNASPSEFGWNAAAAAAIGLGKVYHFAPEQASFDDGLKSGCAGGAGNPKPRTAPSRSVRSSYAPSSSHASTSSSEIRAGSDTTRPVWQRANPRATAERDAVFNTTTRGGQRPWHVPTLAPNVDTLRCLQLDKAWDGQRCSTPASAPPASPCFFPRGFAIVATTRSAVARGVFQPSYQMAIVWRCSYLSRGYSHGCLTAPRCLSYLSGRCIKGHWVNHTPCPHPIWRRDN